MRDDDQAQLGCQFLVKLEAKEPSCDEEDDGDNKLQLTTIHKTCKEVLFKVEMAKPDVDNPDPNVGYIDENHRR